MDIAHGGGACRFRHLERANPALVSQQENTKPKRRRSRSKSKGKDKGQPTNASYSSSNAVNKILLCRTVTSLDVSKPAEQCFVTQEHQYSKEAVATTSSCLRTRTTSSIIQFQKSLDRTIKRQQQKPTVGYDEKRTDCGPMGRFPYKRLRQSLKKARYRALLLQGQVHSSRSYTSASSRKTLNPVGVANPIKERVLDSGAPQDLVCRKNLDQKEQDKIQQHAERVFQTASGNVNIGDRVDMTVKTNGTTISAQPLVLDEGPDILSLGQRIADGYSFEWLPNRTPTKTAPNGQGVSLKVENFVPVITADVLKLLTASSTENVNGSQSQPEQQAD